MYNDVFEQATEFNKHFSKPFAQYQSLFAQTAEKLTKLHLNTANEWLYLNVRHVQDLAAIKKPEEYMHLNTHYLNESVHTCLENFHELVNTTLEASVEYNQLINDGLKGFTTNTKKTKNKTA